MPRDSNGNYSLPSGTLVSSGDTVLPSQHNPAFQDVAQALGNSLDRDGKGGMRAPLNMGGFRAIGAADGSSPNDLATVAQVSSAGIPVGAILDYAGTTAPVGYLLCFGQAISRTDFADLFSAIGTTFGAGDGSTTFNVPDLRGRVGAGRDNMGGTSANRLSGAVNGAELGGTGGASTHTLSQGEMPAHSHGVNDPGHNHTVPVSQITTQYSSGTNLTGAVARSNPSTSTTVQAGITLANAGGGGAHNNLQPTIVVNKIIKART